MYQQYTYRNGGKNSFEEDANLPLILRNMWEGKQIGGYIFLVINRKLGTWNYWSKFAVQSEFKQMLEEWSLNDWENF